MNPIRGNNPGGTPFIPLTTPTAERVDAETLNEKTAAKSLMPKADTRDPRVLKAAQMYESQFLRYMLTEMRKTVPESEFMAPNQAEKIFKDQLDDKYVDNWVEKGGVGMSDMIYKQIMERFAPYLGHAKEGAANGNSLGMAPHPQAHHNAQQPGAPRPPVSSEQIKTTPGAKTLQLDFRVSPQDDGVSQPVVSPWAGKITQSRQLDRQSLVRLQHTNGLSSLLQFDGVLTKQPGDSIAEGEKLGQLSPSSQSLVWRINAGV